MSSWIPPRSFNVVSTGRPEITTAQTMKTTIAVMALVSMFGFGTASAQKDKPAGGEMVTLKVKRLACSACAARVQKTALAVDGVKAAKVSQPQGCAEITFDAAKTNPEAIVKAINEKTPFKAEVVAKPDQK